METGLTEIEIKAAKMFLAKRRGRWIYIRAQGTNTDVCSRCKDAATTSAMKRYRHQASKPHIAGAYGITLGRLNIAIRVAKVMEALDDKSGY